LIAGAVGFALGWGGGLELVPRLHVDWRMVFDIGAIVAGIVTGMYLLGLLGGLALVFALVDAGYSYIRSLVTHDSYSILGWSAGDSPSRYLRQMGIGLLGGVASALMLSTLVTVGWRMFISVAGADQTEFAGGRRVLRSAANGLMAAVATWSAFFVPWAIASAIGNGSAEGWLRVGLVPAMGAGLFLGGLAALSRFGIRICLYQQGYLPPRSGRFLRQLVGRGIFIPEAGGYKFRHNLIRAHVGQLNDRDQSSEIVGE